MWVRVVWRIKMDEKIFSITKENGILMARLNKQITNSNELDDLINKLYESLTFFLDLRYRIDNSTMIKIRREDIRD